ncbi:serine-threonine rich protein, putative [Talaromyces stipitatus ATCC 10500]|uniref:Serine-threonine rich protein, putative n=1 Tax=Talaromyces stipitatus (strain ATCC 10500 / CBS 375.48 / QM 6759 / NRRL 1006) TaxID=441959 RepID=B8LUD9_TALSN|nr:serine-threonine rich protein, putative [Talaromyces stipitatus ATCC 10500]EED23712.1 serine-threonine rich protein, putative [Talaromyces stipitatus ATCC 10500]
MVSFRSLCLLAAASVLSTATASSIRRDAKPWLNAHDATQGLAVDVGSGTEIIVISANAGAGSSTKYYNNQAMAAGAIHNVTVGGSAGLVYSPSSINAAVGDIVQFIFEAKNHTVTQSSFATPCEKIVGGFDSGFMPNPDGSMNPPPMLQFQVTTSTPIWMYCAQTGHCGQGMVFSINPTAAKSQAAFLSAAKAQNGTSASGAAGAAGAASSASSGVALAGAASSSAAAISAATPASVAQGSGTMSNGGVCSCSCLCGAAQFPAGAGLGMMGGMGGELAMIAAAPAPSALTPPGTPSAPATPGAATPPAAAGKRALKRAL